MVNSKVVILLVYVDDIVITGNDESLINNTKTLLHIYFKLKDKGSLRYFLGLEVVRFDKGISICQRKYALELIANSSLSATKPVLIPLDQNVKFTYETYDKLINNADDPVLFYPTIYQRLIGMDSTGSRPTVNTNVSETDTTASSPPNNENEGNPIHRKKRGKTSVVWSGFTVVVLPTGTKKAECNYCKTRLTINASRSTTAFLRHLKVCESRVVS
ncbi:uncharacterized protein LOC116117962 [Pistacia vera]|uniref:uncharacterized protein LOC116117962 n=1 Tax=Pistacia vera TaxID=55513 RepID=UPI0012634D02|nr:uncharacterized protein LOC116117962 [Pistacia vera]